MEPENLKTVMAELGLTVHAAFVPWSQSRNFKPGAKVNEHSLNWRVTLRHNGRDVLATDYSAGIGHCPSYKPAALWTIDNAAAVEHECERGIRARFFPGTRTTTDGNPIMPDPVDVVASLAMDSDVLDHATFESWASDLGYDPDSRKAESIYRACLQIALQLRVALGDAGLARLREAASRL